MFGCGGGPKNVIMDQSGRPKKNQSDSGQAPKNIFFWKRAMGGKGNGERGAGQSELRARRVPATLKKCPRNTIFVALREIAQESF